MPSKLSGIKALVETHSENLSFLRFIPYQYRLGKEYIRHVKLQAWYETATTKQRNDFHYSKLKDILHYSYENIPFYKAFYRAKSYRPDSFKRLDEFRNVPIISKDDLREYPLEKRSSSRTGAFKINTGGTSGNPLGFYVDSGTFAREWAYMHNIWGRLGYSYLDAKLTFRGKNIGVKALQYNVIHNEYYINPYIGFEKTISGIRALAVKKQLRFIHGYPSAIYEFCKTLSANNVCADALFQGNLKGVLLGSEYPAPQYRQLIEKVLRAPTISWYGHSEFSVLAYELEPYLYCPFQTYGFAEAQANPQQTGSSLVATSYYNKVSPFIRYDTGDLIEPMSYDEDILSSFKMASGRIGDFIKDYDGNKIPLTAFIFGRHHQAFEKVDFIQIRSTRPGHATLVVSTSVKVSLSDFDLSNVAIDCDLEITPQPIRTEAGKIPLLLK